MPLPRNKLSINGCLCLNCTRLRKSKGAIAPWLEPLFGNSSAENKGSRKRMPPRKEEKELGVQVSMETSEGPAGTEFLRRMEGERGIRL